MVEPAKPSYERFSWARIESAADLPARDERTIDVGLLDMNCGFPNVGHDAIVNIVREVAADLAPDLARSGRRVRVLSYAIRDRLAVPDYRDARHKLYLGTGGPGHLDPRRNTHDAGSAEIVEDPSWEAPLWALFDAIVADESISMYAVCHTFGLLCRWSGTAEAVLRGPQKGGARSGVGSNVLTARALEHPYFARLAKETGSVIPVLDSRYYDLIPTGHTLEGASAIAYESDASGKQAGESMTMLELARDAAGTPRVFGVNSHPEIGDADRVEMILRRMLDEGTLDKPTFEQRSAMLPILRHDRPAKRLRVARAVFGDLIRFRLETLVRGA